MSEQECPNCLYPTPKRAPQPVDDCAQCFYTPAAPAPEEKKDDSCPQCFYTPEAAKPEEKKDDGCPQCFYTPEKK